MHTGVNKKQNNFEHFLTLSFSSFQDHNSVNICPKSTSRTIFQHLRCRPFHSYQQKRSHWLKTLQKSDWTKSPSLCATYCTYDILSKDCWHVLSWIVLMSRCTAGCRGQRPAGRGARAGSWHTQPPWPGPGLATPGSSPARASRDRGHTACQPSAQTLRGT